MHTYDSAANMPSNLFSDLNIRKVFSYAYNYQYYLNQQVGNAIWGTTFGQAFAGALPQGMLYAQSIAQLNASGAAVPYYNMQLANQYWQDFIGNSTTMSALGLTVNGNQVTYNGNPLRVPVFINSGDPVDQAGETTWASAMANFGITLDQITIPHTTLNANGVQNQNPMPIAINYWFPDYPYPSDYLQPIALPSNGSTYLGPADYTPYWIYGNTSNTYQNQTEASILQGMVTDYSNGGSAVTATQAQYWYQKMNEQFVNMTLIVPLQQQYLWRQISSKINPTGVTTYEGNIMVAGDNIMLYQYLSYT